MWCAKCQKEIYECTCEDIEERLRSLSGGPAEIAGKQNLAARKRYQSKLTEHEGGKE